jgi:hypothetical protein
MVIVALCIRKKEESTSAVDEQPKAEIGVDVSANNTRPGSRQTDTLYA